jgi:hypothetical protein
MGFMKTPLKIAILLAALLAGLACQHARSTCGSGRAPLDLARPPLVFILAGQSNMVGFGDFAQLPEELREMPEGVEFFNDGRRCAFADQAHFGPELTFARLVRQNLPQRRLVLIKRAVSGTSLLAWAPQWTPSAAALTRNREAGPLYSMLLEDARTILAGRETELAAVVWMQGERDARYAAAADQYEANLTRLIRSLRADLARPDLPFIFGHINTRNPRFAHRNQVRRAQAAVRDALPNLAMIELDGLSFIEDGLHYDTQGQLELGRRLARAYLDRFAPPAGD